MKIYEDDSDYAIEVMIEEINRTREEDIGHQPYSKFCTHELTHLYSQIDYLKSFCLGDAKIFLLKIESLIEMFLCKYDAIYKTNHLVPKMVMALTMDNTLIYPCVEWVTTTISVSVMVEPCTLNWSILCSNDDRRLDDIVDYQTSSNEEAVEYIINFIKKECSRPSSMLR